MWQVAYRSWERRKAGDSRNAGGLWNVLLITEGKQESVEDELRFGMWLHNDRCTLPV